MRGKYVKWVENFQYRLECGLDGVSGGCIGYIDPWNLPMAEGDKDPGSGEDFSLFRGKEIGQFPLRNRSKRDDLYEFHCWSDRILGLPSQHSKELFHELVGVLKVSVDRGKSNICDPIKCFKFLHDQLSNDP